MPSAGPAIASPSSTEFQTIDAWRDMLSRVASLDLTTHSLNLAQMVDWVSESASNTAFQVEDEGAPVQVMGMLEAAGQHFDHLWIMGLHDEALPAAANLNPFVPTALQRQHNLPHCSAARELDFASTLMTRLLAERAGCGPELSGTRGRSNARAESSGSWRRVAECERDGRG